MILGEPARAEEALRAGYELLTEMQETGVLCSLAAFRAAARYLLDDDEDAWRLTQESEAAAATDDIAAEVSWRAVRAMLLARRGEEAGAESLARDALAQETDFLNMQADTHVALATVLDTAGRIADGSAERTRARELYEEKGNRAAVSRLAGIAEPS